MMSATLMRAAARVSVGRQLARHAGAPRLPIRAFFSLKLTSKSYWEPEAGLRSYLAVVLALPPAAACHRGLSAGSVRCAASAAGAAEVEVGLMVEGEPAGLR